MSQEPAALQSSEAGEVVEVNAQAGRKTPGDKPLFTVTHRPRLLLVGMIPKAHESVLGLKVGAHAVVSFPRLVESGRIIGRVEGLREQQSWLRVIVRLDRTAGLRVGDVGTAEISLATTAEQ